MGKPKKGQPKTRVQLRPGLGDRQPKTIVRHPHDDHDRPKFSFRHVDRWQWCEGDEAAELLAFVCEMSRLTWTEIKSQMTGEGRYGPRHKKHHYQAFDSVSTAAQKRLAELHLDATFEEFFRFRVGGEKRLWGFLVEGVFYALWWDPDHAVKLVTKRGT